MIVRGLVFSLILVMVFLISRQNASQRVKIKQMELDAEAAEAAAAAQPRMGDPMPIDDPMPGDTRVSVTTVEQPAFEVSLSKPEPEPEPEPEPDPRLVDNQSWRDNNPGVVIVDDVSTGCATATTFNPRRRYDGPSGDNYYNYCHQMVLSQSSECRKELCANSNVYGACRNECNAS